MNSVRMSLAHEPLTVLIAALGGQGGGVLTDWIGHAARAQGLIVQATSTPGVSQRTGATTYYLEIAAVAKPGAAPPVLGLTPLPGRVDVLVCAEMLEAARMLERGMCTPSRTTVVASTHRVYTTREKMSGGDGRFDNARIADALRTLSRRTVMFDMEAVQSRHRAAISAVLFGALAGSGALPITRSACEEAIRDAGKGVAASVAAFAEAFECASRSKGGAVGCEDANGSSRIMDHGPRPVGDEDSLGAALAARIETLPERVAEFARSGAAQLLAYQDIDYANGYVDRVERVVRAEAIAGGLAPQYDVARETARFLALWMGYDDVIRVASVKSRASRFARIRDEVRAADADIVRVYDFFKPGALEIAAILPRRLGQWLEQRVLARTRSPDVGKGIRLQSSSVAGALVLRCAAGLRRLRPYSLRFGREQAAIEQWLAVVEHALVSRGSDGLPVVLELARLPRLLKGYGETHSRGNEDFARALGTYAELGDAGSAEIAEALRVMVRASLDHSSCEPPAARRTVFEAGPRAQPVVWVDRH